LLNVTVYPNTYNVVGQSYALMGRIRNNTNTTMLLYDDKKAFNFHIEPWEYGQQRKLFETPEYFHPAVELTSEMTPQADHLEVFSELNEEPMCTRVLQK
jgi:hypothetical protein